MKQKTLFWTILGISVLLVLLIVLGGKPVRQTAKPSGEPAKFTVTKQDMPQEELPKKFPVEFPLEEGAKVLQNYNATTNDGRRQATRMFETAKSLEENYRLYEDFFQENGWTILTTLDQENLKALAASKDQEQLQVTLNLNPTTNISTVEISLTKGK